MWLYPLALSTSHPPSYSLLIYSFNQSWYAGCPRPRHPNWSERRREPWRPTASGVTCPSSNGSGCSFDCSSWYENTPRNWPCPSPQSKVRQTTYSITTPYQYIYSINISCRIDTHLIFVTRFDYHHPILFSILVSVLTHLPPLLPSPPVPSPPTGKTLADARGDIFRGLEVVEGCSAVGHLSMGETAGGLSRGLDTYRLGQYLTVIHSIPLQYNHAL